MQQRHDIHVAKNNKFFTKKCTKLHKKTFVGKLGFTSTPQAEIPGPPKYKIRREFGETSRPTTKAFFKERKRGSAQTREKHSLLYELSHLSLSLNSHFFPPHPQSLFLLYPLLTLLFSSFALSISFAPLCVHLHSPALLRSIVRSEPSIEPSGVSLGIINESGP